MMFVLGRPLEPRHTTNLALICVLPAVLAGLWVSQVAAGAAPVEGLYASLRGMLAVFLGWALARELDPDHPLSAFAAAALALAGVVWLPTSVLLLNVLFLLPLRTINRTVGSPASAADAAVMLGLLWFVWEGYAVVGVGLAATFLLDGLLSAPNRRFMGLAAVPIGVLAVSSATGEGPAFAGLAWPWFGVVGAAALLFLPVILGSVRLVSVGDRTAAPLDPRRVQAAQTLALAVAGGTALAGEPGVVALLPLWSAIAGVGLYRVTVLAPR